MLVNHLINLKLPLLVKGNITDITHRTKSCREIKIISIAKLCVCNSAQLC